MCFSVQFDYVLSVRAGSESPVVDYRTSFLSQSVVDSFITDYCEKYGFDYSECAWAVFSCEVK